MIAGVALVTVWLSTSASSARGLEKTTAPQPAAVSDTDNVPPPVVPHIRFQEPRLQQLVEEGLQVSATLRALSAKLEGSDVVAYVRCDRQLRNRVSGYLSFVSKAGGLRYVLIRIAYLGPREQQVALIGHELRHAVEVADMPAVVDTASFHREYQRIGIAQRFVGPNQTVAYETDNARKAGEQILRELNRSTS